RYLPYDRDALVPAAIAAHLGVRRYAAPFVLEGGSVFVDGEGTLLTTEQCLLNPNRNPALSRAEIERGLRDYRGAEAVVGLARRPRRDRVRCRLTGRDVVPELLPAERRRGGPRRRLAGGRGRPGPDRGGVRRPGDRPGTRQHAERGRRRAALHHPAGPGGHPG